MGCLGIMGQCSGKHVTRTGSNIDILESTTWIREVVTDYQKKKKGVSKFQSFTFEPLGTWRGAEDIHKVAIEFLDGKEALQHVKWIVRVGDVKEAEAGVLSDLQLEAKVRTSLLSELQSFLASKDYKRAKFLINIPDFIFHEIKESGKVAKCHLVLEDVTVTKRCEPPHADFIERGFSLSHMKVTLATLAQFHAVSIAWKQSLRDDSTLDLFPFLAVSRLPSASERATLFTRYQDIVTKARPGENLKEKLSVLRNVCDSLDDFTLEEDMCDPLGGVIFGPVSPMHIYFQFTPPISPRPLSNETRIPLCAAILRVNNMVYSNIIRDLAQWVMTLSNQTVRRYYLLGLLQNYVQVLTSTMEMLGVDWIKMGLTFNCFAKRFFAEVPRGLVIGILIAMADTKVEDITNFLNDRLEDSTKVAEDNTKDVGDNGANNDEKPNVTSYIPLSQPRIEFLVSLLDDVRIFV